MPNTLFYGDNLDVLRHLTTWKQAVKVAVDSGQWTGQLDLSL